MSNQELITRDEPGRPPMESPLQPNSGAGLGAAAAAGANVGAVTIESERAIAQIQGEMLLARRLPRNVAQAAQEFVDACSIKEFADVAFFNVPRGGKTVSGESIRFAEEAARCWGNIKTGHKELSRSAGKSEVEVYAWDLQTGFHVERQLTVRHTIDRQGGGSQPCKSEKEIDDLVNNKAAKQRRGVILAVLPKWFIERGKAQAKKTIAGGSDKPISQSILDMSQAFQRYGVTVKHLETYLEHPLDSVTIDELADLRGIFNAIKEGEKPSDYFTLEELKPSAVAAIENKVAAGASSQAQASASADTAAQAPAPAPRQRTTRSAVTNSKPAEQNSKAVEDPTPPVTQSAAPAGNQNHDSVDDTF